MKEALRSSFEDEVEFHATAVKRLRESYDRLQARLEAMYVDKLDGRVTESFFEAKSAEWRSEQQRIEHQLTAHRAADQNYMEQGVALLELASKARFLYEKQSAPQKRRLLDFLCSNSLWSEDGLQVEFRQPFDILSATNVAYREQQVVGAASGDLRPVWLPGLDSNPQIGRRLSS